MKDPDGRFMAVLSSGVFGFVFFVFFVKNGWLKQTNPWSQFGKSKAIHGKQRYEVLDLESELGFPWMGH